MKYKDWLDVWFANYIEPSSILPESISTDKNQIIF